MAKWLYKLKNNHFLIIPTLQTQTQTTSESTQLSKSFDTSTASSSNPKRTDQSQTTRHQIPTNKMGVITVVNNSASDIYVSVTYDGDDFQKGGSELWTLLKANGGKDTWGYRNNNQIARVVRSQNAGAPVESYLAVQDKTVYIN
ncbi:hypothetical protein SS1G_03299 [Sclerotinia sclerotiorum 1980 UF-70]|uniref:Uncharacterized protein n=1 Tax=Sclerotinia sclerotiorum (strain ATCC 18683 / 1980 / Ss-1) TaxID=665079 RepID=A7EDA9_SCLS1|nr:hypothetical protein SS1G_03299 [Sclerotinia sclerotiorum 1980 UF-70]EDO00825.1 hypothetical protein SS1G_03299 [Sclerotinia sclerotiorum 1980 UF-70]